MSQAFKDLALEHVPRKLPGFFDHEMRQLFDFERVLVVVAGTSFWIHELRLRGEWSPIHLLSIFTLVTLPLGVWRAHSHNVPGHKWTMISIFCGGLLIAGLFTFVPGRIMHAVAFGN